MWLSAFAATPPCGFLANLKIDRRDYCITYGRKDDPNFIGNIVDVNLHILATKPRTPRS